MSVLVVSLLLIAVLLAGLLVVLVDSDLPRRLLGRLHLDRWHAACGQGISLTIRSRSRRGSSDGSSLYQSEQRRGRDFWLVRPDGSERPWSYRTRFGRKRPLPPPTDRRQKLG
jgi:hypothetical protein